MQNAVIRDTAGSDDDYKSGLRGERVIGLRATTDAFTIMALLLDCAALAWLRVNLKKWYK